MIFTCTKTNQGSRNDEKDLWLGWYAFQIHVQHVSQDIDDERDYNGFPGLLAPVGPGAKEWRRKQLAKTIRRYNPTQEIGSSGFVKL